MRLCILCEDSKVDEVRQSAESIRLYDVLRIPLSADGNLPATHWFCFLTGNKILFNKIKSIQKHSIVETIEPRQFLAKWNLKIIR